MKPGPVIDMALELLYWAIFIRALLSWINVRGGAALVPLRRVLEDLTEPILAPIRRVTPGTGGIDLSPLLAMIVVDLIRRVARVLLS